MHKRAHIFIIMIALLCMSLQGVVQPKSNEYELKAAFVFGFTKYVELNNLEQNFVIGVLGNSPIFEELENHSINKKVNNKKVVIQKLLHTSDISNCQIIFVPEFVSFSILKEFLESEKSKNVLIITEKKGALDVGSGINFLLVDNKIKFEINMGALNQQNIKASAQLLKLAVNIKN